MSLFIFFLVFYYYFLIFVQRFI